MLSMFPSSSASPFPSTPHTNRSRSIGYNDYKPLNSSPLTMGSSPASSPIQQAQERRKSQYKARTSSATVASPVSSETGSILRERFKSSCLQRAQNARKRIVKNKRRLDPMGSSNGLDEDMDEDEDVFEDEILRRVMLNEGRKQKHNYRLSYYDACGDSFDPDLEDVGQWEHELEYVPSPSLRTTSSRQPQTPKRITSTSRLPSSPLEPTPEDLEDAELEAYAEECERQAALADFEDIPVNQLFEWDDEELSLGSHSTQRNVVGHDVDMEV
ncbi:hypothetical protein WG66_006987 [Moniliophthora roreri]|nr:hypothetical protein WG66_006987 [Moniliophthora roreri]